MVKGSGSRRNETTSRRSWLAVLAGAVAMMLVPACSSGERSPADGSPSEEVVVQGEPYYMSAVDKAYYQTLAELFNAAEVVVVGEVVKVEPGVILSGAGVHPDEEGFPQMGVITVRVDQLLRGAVKGSTATVHRESFLNEAGELRPLILEGFGPDRVGNKVLWFLEQRPDWPEGIYEMVSFDGLLYIEDGMITTPRSGEDTLAHETAGRSAADVIAELSGLDPGAAWD